MATTGRGSTFFNRAAMALAVSALFLLALGEFSDLDLFLADLYFDPQRQLFPWDRTWFARDLMHGSVKNVVVWLGFLLIGAALIDLIFPLRRLTACQGSGSGRAGKKISTFRWVRLSGPARARLRLLALAAFSEPALISLLKRHSALHCPWAVDRYGGRFPFLRLLDSIPDGWQNGHCFPAGHASSAMWLAAFAVLWLPQAPKKALATFAAGMGCGLVFGWVQQMRGQHFLSHTLWTAWLSSALLLALIVVFRRQLLVLPVERQGEGV